MPKFTSTHLAIGVLLVLAFVPRFWNLHGLADVVFDEVYYPEFAQKYLIGGQFFDAHPPLGKYLIALGIQLFGYHPWGYRWMSALAGALVPIVVYSLVHKWSRRPQLAWLAAIFTCCDGLLLVESRYGLINIFLVLFGLISQWSLWSALFAPQPQSRWLWVMATGLFLGASISVKWTGLGYWLASLSLLLWTLVYCHRSLPWYQILVGLGIIPAIFYLGQWLPHLRIATAASLIELHQQMWSFHQNLGTGEPLLSHPYCSQWWTWSLNIRPVAYFYDFRDLGIAHVLAMGNPLLYWFSTGAVLYAMVRGKLHRLTHGLAGYACSSWLVNLLPWALTPRCTFIYHYMPASIFAFICLAIVADLCLKNSHLLTAGIIICAGVSVAFVLWLPIYIGLPIPPIYWRMLIWFPTWL
jgi:dolichyl-phosphate-mannose-protein mannosyltransferase